ncbi:MAG: FG-GAP-like repeat-containing protein [Saprospiraceae bacterium]|nr:FG-GAP-like repeat-containing protein [Saprospiraceae bacterium]
MNIIKSIFVSICIFFVTNAYTQVSTSYGDVFHLNAPNSDGNYIARDYIKLLPGFSSTVPFNAKIDEGWPYHNTSYQEFIVPNERIIDKTLPVGATIGKFEVNPMGAATYQIPIFASPGTNGIQPNLSLAYNSQSSSGIAGMGWNIAGISSITRTGKDIYLNSKKTGVQFSYDDQFALDGQPLVGVSGNYGYNGAIYRTGIESFSNITSHGAIGNGPAWFELKTKNGLTIEYGNDVNSNNAQLIQTGGASVLRWYINKITDQNGNYMTYSYYEKSGEIFIKSIKYTYNDSKNLDAYNELKFGYSLRSDISEKYVMGTKLNQTVLLDCIKSYCEGNLVKKYELNYYKEQISDPSTTNDCSYLNEIIEIGDKGTQRNSTLFGYGDFNYTSAQSPENYPSLYADYLVGDYDGNGRSDIIAFVKSSAYVYSNYKLFLNIDGAFIETISNGYLPTNFTPFPNNEPLMKGARSMDMNGDGKDELVLGNGLSGQYHYAIHSFNSITSTFVQVGNTIHTDLDHNITFGDFDGDGRLDMFIYNTSNEVWSIYMYGNSNMITGTGFIKLDGSTSINNSLDGDYFYPIDFNGDGTTKLLCWQGSTSMVLDVQIITPNPILIQKMCNSYFPISNSYSIGDFNKDGISDILSTNSVNWWKSIGTGNDYCSAISIPLNQISTARKQLIADFNGDGIDDIGEFEWNSPNDLDYNYYYSTGINYLLKSGTTSINTFTSETDALLGDFNGDGGKEILFITGSNLEIVNTKNNNDKYCLHQIIDGIGKEINIRYNNLRDGDNSGHIYSRNSNSTNNYPIVDDFTPSLEVVKVYYTKRINNQANPTWCFYEDIVLHNQGKGFLGFKKTKKNNSVFDREIINSSTINTYRNTLELTDVETNLSNGTKLLEVKNTYDYKVTFSTYYYNVIYPYVKTQEMIDFVNDIVTSSDITCNNNGNITEAVVNHSNTSNVVEGTTTTKFELFTANGSWLTSKPQKITVTKKRGTEADYIRIQEFTYDTKGRLINSILDNGKIKSLTKTFAYDGYGNLINSSTIGGGVALSPSSINIWDSKGRFLIQKKNSLLQTSTYTYDPIYGNILTSEGIDGHQTTYNYAEFGLLSSTELPTSEIIYHDFQYESPLPNVNGFVKHTYSNWNTWSKSYYDRLGREIKTEATSFHGAIVCTSKIYNDKNELTGVTQPYFTGQTPSYSGVYTYEADGRIKTENINGLSTTYTYDATNKRKTTIDDPGFKTEKIINAYGQPITIKDKINNIINYTYYSSGQPKDITSMGSNIHMEYDEYGNQILLRDPDAGDITYEYDAFGQLLSQTDAESNTYTMTYDIAGRFLTKTGSDASLITYNYVPAGNGINQIASVISSNGINQYYQYDNFGRTIEAKEFIDGVNYITNFAYNSKGELIEETYPSGFAIEYSYDNYGFMNQIKDAQTGQNLYSINSNGVNSRGQVTDAVYGNNISATNAYDVFGAITGIQRGNIQDYNLTIDYSSGGTISTREDLKYPTTSLEYFTYDNLNRLKDVYQNDPHTQTIALAEQMEYYDNGNIKTKSNVGTYDYFHPTKKHALTSISPLNGGIATYLSQQTISYTPFNKTSEIIQGTKKATFTYGPDQLRSKLEYFTETSPSNYTLDKKKYYSGSYEKEIIGSNTRELHSISDFGIYVIENGASTGTMYFTFKDHLGSIKKVTDINGNLIEDLSYDAWGNRRNPATLALLPSLVGSSWTGLFDRGFTGHEHMDGFGLINMNGRMYDPLTGRVMSPDNNVQAIGSSQNLNRYSYCMNNPLMYNDPNGEFIIGPALMMGALGLFVVGSTLDHLLNPGDYDDANTGEAFKAGFNQGLNAYKEINSLSQIPIYNDNGLTITVGPSLTGLGVTGGASYTNGDWTFSAGGGIFGYGSSIGGGITYYDRGNDQYFGYYYSHFNGRDNYFGTKIDDQNTGGIAYRKRDFSFKFENDILAFEHQDRWRTGGIEIAYKDIVISNQLYENDPEGEGSEINEYGLNRSGKLNRPMKDGSKIGAWIDGYVYRSTLSIGYKTGSTVAGIGLNQKSFQEVQNVIHRWVPLGRQNYYNNYTKFTNKGFYGFSTNYNPYSVYGYY